MARPKKSRPEDWKDEYFKVLNELDAVERDGAERLARLSRDLLAVLGTMRGLAPEFDAGLDTLERARELHEHDAQDRLRRLVDFVDAHGAAANDPAPSAAPAPTSPEPREAPAAPCLRELLERLPVPADARGDVDALRHRLDAASDAAEDGALVEAMAGLIGRMLGDDDDAVIEARDSLQTLIDHLSLPASAHTALDAITPRLQAATDAPSIRAVAKDLADFVVDFVGELQGEIAGLNTFLLTIRGRLDDVAGHIDHENADRVEAAAARQAFDDSVQRSLGAVRNQMSEVDDVDTLKNEIEARLAALDGHVSTFLDAEGQRAEAAEARSRGMAEELAAVRRESETLRENLDKARKSAVRDPLTGLPNRLAYNERIKAEFARHRRAGHPLSLVVLDIDKFKGINDTYGHLAGDRVLKHMARELRDQVRTQDFFGRFGGEEFVVLLPDTARAGAVELAEKLRRHMETRRFTYKKTPVSVTISCGVAEFTATDTIESAFSRADEGLYAAKENGRNRTEAIDP